MSPRASLALACAVTAVLLVAAAVLRITVEDPTGTPLPDRLMAVLAGTGLLLFALLALPRLPGLGWPAVALAATIGAIEVVAVIRSLESVASPSWRDLVFIGGVALIGGVLVAAGYSNGARQRSSNPARTAMLLVGIGVAATSAAAVWAIVDATELRAAPGDADELTPLRIAARIALATMASALVVGVARSLGPPAIRARDRLRATPRDVGGGRLWQLLGLFGDELVPARVAGRQRAAESERARLAADLHALVLPDLRQAAAAAASAGAPAEMQLDLRRALDDVEQLMHERQSIVLEQFGLVAALEWLAERTEERSQVRVELELDPAVPDGAEDIHPDVARAAFRIALLGLDNVVRHANARTATLRLSLDDAGLRLVVQDDGTATTSFESTHGRGLADMRTEAAASGGSIEIVSGTGARIEAGWNLKRVAGNHAIGNVGHPV